MADKVSKDRQSKGEKNQGILTQEQVLDIIEKYKTGNFNQSKLGRMFGVGQPQISKILSGNRWSHIMK